MGWVTLERNPSHPVVLEASALIAQTSRHSLLAAGHSLQHAWQAETYLRHLLGQSERTVMVLSFPRLLPRDRGSEVLVWHLLSPAGGLRGAAAEAGVSVREFESHGTESLSGVLQATPAQCAIVDSARGLSDAAYGDMVRTVADGVRTVVDSTVVYHARGVFGRSVDEERFRRSPSAANFRSNDKIVDLKSAALPVPSGLAGVVGPLLGTALYAHACREVTGWDKRLRVALLLHHTLLLALPLGHRSFASESAPRLASSSQTFFDLAVDTMETALRGFRMSKHTVWTHPETVPVSLHRMCDLYDSTVFAAVLAEREPLKLLPSAEWACYLTELAAVAKVDVGMLSTISWPAPRHGTQRGSPGVPSTVAAVSNPLVDWFVEKSGSVEALGGPLTQLPLRGKYVATHFHSNDPLRDMRSITTNPAKPITGDKWKLKQKQLYAKFQQTLAESLAQSGAVPQHLVMARSSPRQPFMDHELPQSRKAIAASAENQQKEKKKKAPKPGQGGVSTNKVKAEAAAKVRERQVGCFKEKVGIQCAAECSLPERIRKLVVDMRSGRVQPEASGAATLQLADWAMDWWRESKIGKQSSSLLPAVVAVRYVTDCFAFHLSSLSAAVAPRLLSFLCGLGFAEYTEQLSRHWSSAMKQGPLTIPPAEPGLSVGMDFATFQLKEMGSVLYRCFGTAPDPRVDFCPDSWQREVLDIVDAGESCLVVAATSLGKTFVAYYAIQKAVREHGLVVYCCPTKALTNQASVEVYARCRSASVGVFTRDYRYNVDDCSVLVTVPQVLDLLLSSPSWDKRRVAYCILDEVHCVQQCESLDETDSGVVWENVIKLLPCPFLALSATLGNPELFLSWLRKVQQEKYSLLPSPPPCSTVRLVGSGRRFTEQRFFAVTGPESLVRIHPASTLCSRPPSEWAAALNAISLCPEEALSLYLTLVKHIPGDPALDELAPSKVFPSWKSISRDDIYDWEVSLKGFIDSMTQRKCGKVVWEALCDLGEEAQVAECDFEERAAWFLPLLRQLDATGDLPAIVFSWSQAGCEILATSLVSRLESLERDAGLGREASVPVEKSSWEMRLAKKKRDKQDRGKDRDEPQEDEEDVELPPLVITNSRFSFAGKPMPKELREYWERKLRKKSHMIKPELLVALKRGIGVHHAGLPKQFRSLVEAAFRAGQLRVIFSTSTLALGVNMPARTVIFSGDSQYLDPLASRQMAGRAGRRGIDNAGKIIFFGLPESRVHDILSSRLPSITGQMESTVTTTLRALVAFHEADSLQKNDPRSFAVTSFTPLSSARHIGEEDDSVMLKRRAVLFLTATRLLYEAGLINGHGEPTVDAALAVHLHYHHPANLLLSFFITKGVLNQRCVNVSENPDDASRALLQFLCHVFNPVPVAPDVSRTELRERTSPSLVFLPELGEDDRAALQSYEQRTLTVFTEAFVRVCSADAQYRCKLPLSGEDFGHVWGSADSEAPWRDCRNSLVHCICREPFAALSPGAGDKFSSAQELCFSSRSCVSCDPEYLPLYDTRDASLAELPLNSYALDFYKHGDLAAIERDNEVVNPWRYLKDWNLLLRTLSVELQRDDHSQPQLAQTANYLSDNFSARFKAI